MLFAKEAGPTSFASLGVIKKALGTGKVGHTGTLDSFAEGLLVVLVGKMTRLVPYITAASKKYLAVVAFGTETDTLESSGAVVREGNIPSRQQLEAALPRFLGKIMQVPPAYSAVHVEGRRASDLARSGAAAPIPPREIVVHSLELLDFDGQYGLLEVACSKGTYVRALARDIAAAAGSCAHLVALRRVAVGPFQLEDAVFASRLGEFTLSSRGMGELPPTKATAAELEEVACRLIQFTPGMARSCGLAPLSLSGKYGRDFFQGRPPQKSWFKNLTPDEDHVARAFGQDASFREFAVFAESGELVGMIKKIGEKLQYGFVIPQLRI